MTNQLPAYLQAYQAPDVGNALSQNLGPAMPPHVSIGGGRFTLIDAANNELPGAWFDQKIGVYVDACIVDVNNVMSRIYFSGAYDNDAEGVRPDCWSDNGIGPSISASSPQAPSCQPDPTGQTGCKWAVWGSKINANGKKVPACSQKQKVALLIPASGFNTLFLLAIPPNSHGPLREYVERCKGNQMNIVNLLTRISFVPGVQGTLMFQPVSYIDEPTAKLRQAAYAEKKTDALVGRNDVPRPVITSGQGYVNPPPVSINGGSAQQIAAPAQQPAQQVQQPDPLQPQTSWPVSSTISAGVAAMNQPSSNAAATFAGNPAPQADQPAQQRRRRRTAAEMQAAQQLQPNGQAPVQPTGAPQAPFPHPGQQTAPEANFGIAQPAQADPALGAMLDDFFGQS
jgi:hypothetical protein